jgi:hypothetical protein
MNRILRKNSLTSVAAVFGLSLITLAGGCYRGSPSENPPIHPNPNMYDQPKYKAQSESQFFEDGATMRHPVDGTVARDQLNNDDAYYRGIDSTGKQIEHNPVPVNMTFLKRGQERFNIYCSPCHSRVGDGQGIMIQKGYVPPPSFHLDRLRQVPDGYIFDVITNGIRNMPAYKYQVPVADRWAIVAYVRALQRAHDATYSDIPLEMAGQVK